MTLRNLFRGLRGSMVGGQGVPGGQGGCLGYPMEPSGWFDGSPDDS